MARVSLTAFILAAVTFATISYLGKQMDMRRLEQLRVSRLNNSILTVLADLDRYLIRQEMVFMDDDLHQMKAEMGMLKDCNDPLGIASVEVAFDRFTKAVDHQRSAVEGHYFAKAREIKVAETEPTFNALNDLLASLDGRLQAQAAVYIAYLQMATAISLFVSAALVTMLFAQFRKKVEAMVFLQVQQSSVESSERKLKALIQNNSDVIAVMSRDGNLVMVSDACEKAWGIGVEELVGRSVYDAMDPADALRIQRTLAELLPAGLPLPALEIGTSNGHGGRGISELHMTDLLDDPDVGGLLLTFHDLTERKKYEAELTYHAFHDRLTDLPNRALFLDRLTHRMKAQEEGGEGFAVLFIDLDNFKIINDSLGHEAGDTLLVEVAARLRTMIRPCDTVARLGGDEFTIILDEVCTEQALEVSARIQRSLVRPLRLGEREVFVTCSLGIVMTADSGPDAAGLLRDADTAMYQAKANGKARLAVFEPGMNLLALDRLELESDLRVAILEGQFFLTYQPVVDIESGRPLEVEALIRWEHPVRGVVSPNAFIPLAEETGLICPIGRWAFREACAQLVEWNRENEGGEPLRLSVNVSGRQLQEKSFVAEVEAVLGGLGLDPRLVELEVTETAMLKDMDRMRDVLTQLRMLGLRVAIDDFGTGYSSMAYLSQLPVDKLKIDRSFVIPLGSDSRAQGVVQAMITMARTLGLGITGEGIETLEQLRALQRMGCDLGQGYLFDRPLSAPMVTQMLAAEGRIPAREALPMAA